MNIVLIDDEPLQLEIVTEMLKSIDASINVYHSITDVVDKKADIIILDLYMPEKSGWQICEELQKGLETKDIPVFILSSSSQSEDKERSYSAGAIDYIEKPVSRDALEKKVRRYANLSKMMREVKALANRLNND